ncbi:MAG: 4-alpha-glucanotransferase, partial [Candidatus Eremiobacteraeota bacterium]|nr:4-alpha-glucanotransferase [Candidatus Eremiobacteraeota bacterium]
MPARFFFSERGPEDALTAPAHAYLPPALEHGRAWGFGLNLYALRSKRNWGIGDFTDLREFVHLAVRSGADVVGVNPLHALHYVEPDAASPYSPTSRYFLNPLYIDVEGVPEFFDPAPKAQALRERVASEPFAHTLATLRAAGEVAYGRIARAKYSALAELYAVFRERRGHRREAFRAYAAARGERLERFAIYEALTERFARDDGRERGWLTWPLDFQHPDADAVREFAVKSRRRIDYFKYLQWLADDQLASVAETARALSIGLYRDVAVGVDVNSADVWSDQGAYILEETVGAPPDPLGPNGQNWGLPPLDPARMLDDGGAAFAELLAANMAHAGALRLDHAMALLRLFRIPRGKSAAEGTYVAYPFEQLLAIATNESLRARCTIVGEDLGTVPDGFRDRMAREAIFSYRLLLFERGADGRFISPAAYPEYALATATTHDLPTLPGWSIGRDIDARSRIGLIFEDGAADAHATRRVDVSLLLEALLEHGALDRDGFEALHRTIDARVPDAAAYDPLTRAAYRYLALSPARLVLVQLDDATGEFEQVNLPGTFVEYPNWRRKSR